MTFFTMPKMILEELEIMRNLTYQTKLNLIILSILIDPSRVLWMMFALQWKEIPRKRRKHAFLTVMFRNEEGEPGETVHLEDIADVPVNPGMIPDKLDEAIRNMGKEDNAHWKGVACIF